MSSPDLLPFFHWVDIGHSPEEWLVASTWDPAFAVRDEDVFSAVIEHKEGQIPSLTIEIKNPGVGLLAPGRPLWAWFSTLEDGAIVPQFFGRMEGVPTDLLGNTLTIVFTARSVYYTVNKQIAAEKLKVRPGWDPVFLDVLKRDDPDAILEGYSKLWHVDRRTLAITPSDILTGEDGLVTFTTDDVPFDSVKVTLKQIPLVSIAVDATIAWEQQYTGFLDSIDGTVESYSGDGIISDWPAPLSQLGSGWSVYSSLAKDANKIASAQNTTLSAHYENHATKHSDGDVLRIDVDESYPIFNSAPDFFTFPLPPDTSSVFQYMSYSYTPGFQDARALDIDGDPAPINQAFELDYTASLVPLWRVNYFLGLRYDADRARTERMRFILSADTQPVLVDPLITQDTEAIDVPGANVGLPIVNLLNWTSVAGQLVKLGTFIFPDNPTVPGQKSIQICVVSGIAGLFEPVFSTVAGVTTVDGSVTWSSLGESNTLNDTTADWQPFTLTGLGKMILPRIPVSIPYSVLIKPGFIQIPKVGVSVGKYEVVFVPGKGYFQCQTAGVTWTPGVSGSVQPNFNTGTSGIRDGTVIWYFIGAELPTGVDYFICTHAGTTGEFLPRFGDITQAQIDSGALILVNDNDVVWARVGVVEVPVGGSPGHTPANFYYPSDRGLWSVEYLLQLARARLRLRSRAVEISFDCKYEKASQLSCRMSAQVFDPRLPGGTAIGKVTAYKLTIHGDKSEIIANVTIGCAVGNGTSAISVPGTPVYVEEGYFNPGEVQQYTGSYVLPADSTDVAYAPPIFVPSADDFNFPLTNEQVYLNGGPVINGSLGTQKKDIAKALYAAYLAANVTPTDELLGITEQELAQKAAQNSVQANLQAQPIWISLDLKPVNGVKFDNVYTLSTSLLSIPKQIDLEAGSISPSPPVNVPTVWAGGAALHGFGTLRVAPNVPLGNTGVRFAGVGTLTVATIQTHMASVGFGFAAIGTMVTKTQKRSTAQAGFSANGTLRVSALEEEVGRISLSGSGIMTARAIMKASASKGFAGVGTMTASAILKERGSAALSGSGTMVTVGS